MKKQRLVAMTESAVMAALSLILNFIIVFKMPQGGSITLGAMVPIMIVALRRGAGWGILAGVLSGLLQFITTGQAAHPLSILLDYLLAYGVLGITGFFKGSLPKIALGMTLTIFLRFACHLLSGATIFASHAPEGQNPWLYSMGYNASYMIFEWIITTAITVLLYKYAKRLFAVK